ncbi:hypothetical protein PSFL111601_08850 [Pseudomonas floridensis]
MAAADGYLRDFLNLHQVRGLQLAGGLEPVIHAIDALRDGVDGFQVCS